MKPQYLSYSDVFLKPRYSTYHSRSEVSPSVKLGNKQFKVPAVPANMECTIDPRLALWMSENDYFYIMHRFNKDKTAAPNTDNLKFIKLANKDGWKTISVSVGVKEEDKQLIRDCIASSLRIDYITIDIAHAHSVRMKEMLKFLHDAYASAYSNQPKPFIIAGNVATPAAVVDLESWGSDATKVGIAQGDACTTYGQTGFGLPMFTCVMECAEAARKPIIADGGIRMNGDFAKALRAGGTMVMAGSVFASCIDSPAETVFKYVKTHELKEGMKIGQNGLLEKGFDEIIAKKTYKVYYGSASATNKGNKNHVEGRTVELECNKMTYSEKLAEIEQCLQSSVSYAGGNIRNSDWGVRYNHAR